MKKIYLFLVAALMASMSLSAQVAFLQRVDDAETGYPAEEFNSVAQKPEKNAYDWFKTQYVNTEKGTIISMEQVKTISANDYKVLWVNVDEEGLTYENFKNAEGAGFTQEVINGITEFVRNGGNLLLTKQATCLAYEIGRFGHKDNGNKLDQEWICSADYGTAAIRNINPKLGSGLDNGRMRDCRQHPIYDGLTQTDDKFILVSDESRTNHLLRWREFERKDGVTARLNNDNVEQLNLYQSDWACDVLAITGNITDFCLPEILELHPQGDYKGSIITITAAAYQWGTHNTGDPLENVKKLTSNALSYLSNGGDEYGYMMPYTLSELYSLSGEEGSYRPDYEAANWFYETYVKTNKGRFIHKGENFPNGMKVLWVNNDRSSFTDRNTFYNDLGGNAFIMEKLKTFVKNGGNVFLSKQAVRLVNDIGRMTATPVYRMNGWQDYNENSRYLTADFYALKDGEERVGHDRHTHPVYFYLPTEAWVTHYEVDYGENVFCKYKILDKDGDNGRYTDNNSMWENENWNGFAGPTDINRANKFETDYTCTILGGYGHTTALDGAGFVEFYPQGDYKGTVITLGVLSYQWGTNNGLISNVQNLTQGILEYLYRADIYTRTVTAGNFGTICLPRASASTEGATFYRAVGKILDGSNPSDVVIEEVAALEAGMPYIFQASADEITVNYIGAAVVAPNNSSSNGLIGSFIKAPIADNSNYYILQSNKLKPQNGGSNFVGENRAYFDLGSMSEYDPSLPASAPRRRMSIQAPMMPTGMEQTLDNKVQSTKVVENGVFYIIQNGVKYNAQGQRVNQ